MTVYDFNDPGSVARWIRQSPDRHLGQARAMWTLWPQFRDAIEQGVRLSRNEEGSESDEQQQRDDAGA